MHAAGRQPISGPRQMRSLRVSRGDARTTAPSFIQVVQDNGDWFEPHDIVKLVRRARQSTASQLVRAALSQNPLAPRKLVHYSSGGQDRTVVQSVTRMPLESDSRLVNQNL